MPVKIFFCYAREDELLLNKLKTHLRPLQRQGLIEIWHDRDINAGTEWEQEINKHLNEADIILLLISPDFMDSDYCYGVEMRVAIERHKRGEVQVIPIILRPVYWQGEPLGRLQALPKDAIPAMGPGWHNLDQALYDVTEGIRKAVEKLNSATNQSHHNVPQRNPVSIQIQLDSDDIPIPESMSWLEDMTTEKPFSYKWPEEVDNYNFAWKGVILLQGKRINIKIGENERHQRGRLIVFFNHEPICEFAETLDHKGWSSLIKPDGKKTLQEDETPPLLYQGTRIESYRDITGMTRAPNRRAIVILKEDLRSAVHHAVARWLGRRGFPVKPSV